MSPAPVRLVLGLIVALACGCGTGTAFREEFDTPPAECWAAARRAVGDRPTVREDPAAGELATDWVYGESAASPQGLLIPAHDRERYRLEVRIRPNGGGSAVDVEAFAEVRAPGGSGALRWRRVEPDPRYAREFLEALRRELP